MAGPAEFYDGLAAEYDRLFADWWSAATWHGGVVAALLASAGVHPPAAVLDCTCGIGTQALPLAARGYRVTATDISARAVERAIAEAAARGLRVALRVADVRHVDTVVQGPVDAVLSFDNALPHLLTDADLDLALRSLRSCVRSRGLLLASIRDYDALSGTRPDGVPITLHGHRGRRHGAGQSWTWSEEHLDITLFVLTESPAGWAVTTHETTYRALRRETLTAALGAAGFAGVRWLMPDESGYYQPIVVATAV